MLRSERGAIGCDVRRRKNVFRGEIQKEKHRKEELTEGFRFNSGQACQSVAATSCGSNWFGFAAEDCEGKRGGGKCTRAFSTTPKARRTPGLQEGLHGMGKEKRLRVGGDWEKERVFILKEKLLTR